MLFVLHSWAWVGLRNRFTMGHWSFDSQHWLANPMPLSWAPRDMQACYGESTAPEQHSHSDMCSACAVDVNDVYVLFSRLVGHTIGISKLQAFLDLWCWYWAAVGHVLKLSPQDRAQSIPCSKFATTQPAWSEASNEETGLALERDEGEGKCRWEAENCGRAQPALLAQGWMPGVRSKDPSSRCWSCKAKEQTQFLRPMPPAEQGAAILCRPSPFSAAYGQSQPCDAASPLENSRLISFCTNLLRDEVFVPSMLQNWWMWERMFTSTEVMAFWYDPKKKKKKRADLLFHGEHSEWDLLPAWHGEGKFHYLVTCDLEPHQHSPSSPGI